MRPAPGVETTHNEASRLARPQLAHRLGRHERGTHQVVRAQLCQPGRVRDVRLAVGQVLDLPRIDEDDAQLVGQQVVERLPRGLGVNDVPEAQVSIGRPPMDRATGAQLHTVAGLIDTTTNPTFLRESSTVAVCVPAPVYACSVRDLELLPSSVQTTAEAPG